MKTLILALFLVSSCASQKKIQEEPQKVLDKVTHYYQEWRAEYNPRTIAERDFADHYEQYLRSVAGAFIESNKPEEIDIYLQNLRENEKKLENNVSKTQRTESIVRLNDQLNQQRIDILSEELDEEVFDKILDINNEFASKYELGGPGYNFPI